MPNNVVDITVRAKNETDAAFAAAQKNVQSLNAATQSAAAKQRIEALRERQQTRALSGVESIKAVLRGDVTQLDQVAAGWGKVGQAIAKVSMVTGVAVVAWQSGLKVQAALWKAFVESVRDNSKIASEAISSLAKQALDVATKDIDAATKRVTSFAEAYKSLQNEIGRTASLREREARAETEISGGSSTETEKRLAQQALKDAKQSEALARSTAASLQAELDKANAEADKAEANWRSKQGTQGDVAKAFREAADEARKRANKLGEETSPKIREAQQQAEDAVVRSKEAQARYAKAEREESEKSAELKKKAEEDAARKAKERADIAQNIADTEKRINEARTSAEIDDFQGRADKLAEEIQKSQDAIAGIAMDKNARREQTDAAYQKRRDDAREKELRARLKRGVELGDDSAAWLKRRDLEKKIINDTEQRKIEQENAAERAKTLSAEQHRELIDTLNKQLTMLQKNLIAA